MAPYFIDFSGPICLQKEILRNLSIVEINYQWYNNFSIRKINICVDGKLT